MSGTGKRERSPFHETIVDAIHRATRDQMAILALLIKSTRVPKNHEAIIAAWERRVLEFGIGEGFGVTDDLMEQKGASASENEPTVSSFDNSALGKNVYELNLSIRTYRFVEHAHLMTVRDLASRTETELLDIPDGGASPDVVLEIKEVLRELGLSLGMRLVPNRHVTEVVEIAQHNSQTA